MSISIPAYLVSVFGAIFLGILVGVNASRKPDPLAPTPHPLHARIEKLMQFIDLELKSMQYQVTDQTLSRRLFGLRESIQLAYAKAKGELPE